MTAREMILQRLRQKPRTAVSMQEAGLLPARQITRTPVEEFMIQAELSGATIVRCMTGPELTQAKTDFAKADATLVDATLAIAETGSVALRSTDTPSAACYLCDHLVVCVPENRVVHYLNEGLATLKAETSRAVHLMTGPSRTADVEQTIQIGAHGPRQLTLIIYS